MFREQKFSGDGRAVDVDIGEDHRDSDLPHFLFHQRGLFEFVEIKLRAFLSQRSTEPGASLRM